MFIIVVNISTGVCKELEVQQDPVINVTTGETAHLRCRFSHSGSLKVGSFRWYRGAPKGKEVNNDTHPTGIVRVNPETFSRDKDASISILETLMPYQDTYYCEVELMGQKGTGNGTRLIVRKPENKPNTGKYKYHYCLFIAFILKKPLNSQRLKNKKFML
uniref:Natural cytotoxicity triggering receptor 3 n=1 Tax=Erpetoichthys calabaricus TaxID=27687 RepID=A0A8C4RQJ0_ERPCA